MATKILLTKLFSLTFLKVSILLFLCTVLLVPKINAQVPYTPFPKGNISWQSCGSYNPWLYPILPYVLSIDTALVTIENVVYNKVYYDKYPNKEHYICGIREENKKIYLYSDNLGEHLIYDFGLEIGDTLFRTVAAYVMPQKNGDLAAGLLNPDNLGERVFFVARDRGLKTLENGEVRNTLILDGYVAFWDPQIGGPYNYEVLGTSEWVEGLGDIRERGFLTAIHIIDILYLPSVFVLGCIHLDSVMLYITPSYECSHCGGNQINENFQHQTMLYPNPTTGELRIKNYEFRIKSVEVFDILGRKQKGEWGRGQGEGDIKMDISHFPAGVYFVKLITEEGVFVNKIIKK